MYDVNRELEDLEYLLEDDFKLSYILSDTSIRCEDEFSEDWYDESYFHHDYVLKIEAYGSEICECVGEMSLKLFKTSLMDCLGQNRFDVFDSIDDEYSDLGFLLENNNKLKGAYEDADYVLYLEKLFVNKSIRNKGIAHKVLSQIYDIIDWYLEIFPDIVILKSYPIETKMEHAYKDKETEEYYNEFNEVSYKLNKLYSDCDFNIVKDNDSYYFYKLKNE